MGENLEKKVTDPAAQGCIQETKDPPFFDRTTGGCECTNTYSCRYQGTETVNQLQEDGGVNVLAKCMRYQVKK